MHKIHKHLGTHVARNCITQTLDAPHLHIYSERENQVMWCAPIDSCLRLITGLECVAVVSPDDKTTPTPERVRQKQSIGKGNHKIYITWHREASKCCTPCDDAFHGAQNHLSLSLSNTIVPLSFMSELFRGELMTMTVPLLLLSVPDTNFIWVGSHKHKHKQHTQLMFQFQLPICFGNVKALCQRQNVANRGVERLRSSLNQKQ